MCKQFYFISAALLFSTGTALSQKNLRISLLNEGTNVPSYRILTLPIHPGISIGTDLRVKDGKHWQKTLGVDASFYHHRLSENAFMLDGTYGIGYKFRFGLQPRFMAAVGYKQSFSGGETYEFKNGSYESSNAIQKAQINLKMGFGLQFILNEKLSLSADYRSMLASPFSKSQSFTLHNIFRIGAIYNLKTTKNEKSTN